MVIPSRDNVSEDPQLTTTMATIQMATSIPASMVMGPSAIALIVDGASDSGDCEWRRSEVGDEDDELRQEDGDEHPEDAEYIVRAGTGELIGVVHSCPDPVGTDSNAGDRQGKERYHDDRRRELGTVIWPVHECPMDTEPRGEGGIADDARYETQSDRDEPAEQSESPKPCISSSGIWMGRRGDGKFVCHVVSIRAGRLPRLIISLRLKIRFE